MCISVERVTGAGRTVLEGLLRTKFAEDGTNQDAEALTKWDKWIDEYFSDAHCIPLVIKSGDKACGFALVKLGRKPAGPDGRTRVEANFVEEFFILPSHRRKGIGTRVVDLIFRDYPGRWIITTWPGGMGVGFWRYIAMGRPGIRGREYGPDEHKGYPGQYVWVVESSQGTAEQPH